MTSTSTQYSDLLRKLAGNQTGFGDALRAAGCSPIVVVVPESLFELARGDAPDDVAALLATVTAEDRANIGLTVIVLKTADNKSRLMRVIAPLGVLLPSGLGLKIDQTDIGRARREPPERRWRAGGGAPSSPAPDAAARGSRRVRPRARRA